METLKTQMTSKKILFLIKTQAHDSYGVTSGLYNSAQFVTNFLSSCDIETKLVSVVDGNCVDKEVTLFNPDIVVLEALWVTPAKLQELINIPRHKERRWLIRVHSKAPFLANEGMATIWIKDYTRIKTDKVFIAPNTEELTKQFTVCFPSGRFIYLPNLYEMENVDSDWSQKTPGVVNVGCFGALRPMKNQYLQAMAAIEFATSHNLKLRFHINVTRKEQSGENALKNITALFKDSTHELVEHGWYNHKDFLKVSSTMDIGCQVSFSESFNIVTADFVHMGVPIVVCDDIEWMPDIMRVSPTDWERIATKMGFAYWFRKPIAWIQRLYLKWYSAKAELIWIENFLIL